MLNPSQEPPVSSKAPNHDLKDMYVLCTYKIKIERTNLEYGLKKTNDHIQIKIELQNPSQEPPASSKTQNQDLKNMGVLCTFKIKRESQNLEHRCTKGK